MFFPRRKKGHGKGPVFEHLPKQNNRIPVIGSQFGNTVDAIALVLYVPFPLVLRRSPSPGDFGLRKTKIIYPYNIEEEECDAMKLPI